jgi:hypothetical protein
MNVAKIVGAYRIRPHCIGTWAYRIRPHCQDVGVSHTPALYRDVGVSHTPALSGRGRIEYARIV